ncbi:hypothetical protein [Burkholderia pyrrocinia]
MAALSIAPHPAERRDARTCRKRFSAGFQPTPPYLIIRPERRVPAAIGHADGMTRRQRLPPSDRRVARRAVDKTGNARPRVSQK